MVDRNPGVPTCRNGMRFQTFFVLVPHRSAVGSCARLANANPHRPFCLLSHRFTIPDEIVSRWGTGRFKSMDRESKSCKGGFQTRHYKNEKTVGAHGNAPGEERRCINPRRNTIPGRNALPYRQFQDRWVEARRVQLTPPASGEAPQIYPAPE
jgi:hypothetical protein